MSLCGSSAQELREYLHNVLSSYEKIYGKNPDERSLGNRLNGIIQRAYEQFGVKIAVIVDEYDVPLQHTYETSQHDECREIYRNFFNGLKGKTDHLMVYDRTAYVILFLKKYLNS